MSIWTPTASRKSCCQINLRLPASVSATLEFSDVYVHMADVTAKFTIFTGKL